MKSYAYFCKQNMPSMPGNKPFTRHLTILRCLRDTSRCYTWSMLRRECEYATGGPISKSTLDHVVRLHLIVNRELVQLLLSFGPDVEVLAPQTLRDTLAEKTHRANEIYSPHP